MISTSYVHRPLRPHDKGNGKVSCAELQDFRLPIWNTRKWITRMTPARSVRAG